MPLLRTKKPQSAQQRIGVRPGVEYSDIMTQDAQSPVGGGSMGTDSMAANPFGNIKQNPALLPGKRQTSQPRGVARYDRQELNQPPVIGGGVAQSAQARSADPFKYIKITKNLLPGKQQPVQTNVAAPVGNENKPPIEVRMADYPTMLAKKGIETATNYGREAAARFKNVGELWGQTAGKVGSAFAGEEPLPYNFTEAQDYTSDLQMPTEKWKQKQNILPQAPQEVAPQTSAPQFDTNPVMTPYKSNIQANGVDPSMHQDQYGGQSPLDQSYNVSDNEFNQERETVKPANSSKPDDYIATNNGWIPKENILPGNDFSEANTMQPGGYFDQTGYKDDDDPRMIQRRKEAKEVQAGRKRFIEDSVNGKYGSGVTPSFSGGRMNSGDPWGNGSTGGNIDLNDPEGILQRQYDMKQQDLNARTQNSNALANRKNENKLPSAPGFSTTGNEKKTLAQTKHEYQMLKDKQDYANDSAKHDAEIKNIIQSDAFKSIRNEKDPNKRAYNIMKFAGQHGYTFEEIENYIDKTTNPNQDNFTLPANK